MSAREDEVFLTIWKASAIRARDPTATPTPSSRIKNAASMASMTVIRVVFDHAMSKREWRLRVDSGLALIYWV